MLIEVSDSFGNDIKRLAEAANITPGEVIESSFKNSYFLKEDLLHGKNHFSDFIEEYLSALSSLDNLKSEMLLVIKKRDESDAIQHVFKELFRLASEDITLLNKLFQVYKQSDDISSLL
ncbi:hypothetical protein SAMN04488700_2226 [Carnobacterium iners]|uniref:Uncharacterized protein n=1 Tax=Carnobacterium iners TaxID=1073423 RepID=A0A1X7NMW8_9LACT|nr:hypothetical protein [Carnobacterium iners]SEK31438.1 hypothetical protein SAMN04488114_102147 [Carnobacterium iners]SMH39290.1 hypothetical protein SAMN04488700_2226 [Carnobacterium iners]